jgi:hypothetical protein
MSGGWNNMTLLAAAAGLEERVGDLDLLMETGTREETTQRLNSDTNTTPPQVGASATRLFTHRHALLHDPTRQDSLPDPHRPTTATTPENANPTPAPSCALGRTECSVCVCKRGQAGRWQQAQKRRWASPCQQIMRVRGRIPVTDFSFF